MHLAVLLIVVWFYSADTPPMVITTTEPTMHDCQAARPSAQAGYAYRPGVREATAICHDFVKGNSI